MQLSSPVQVDSGSTYLYRLPVCLGMELELPSLLWGSFCLPHSPGNGVDCGKTGNSVPPAQVVTALMVYVMVLHTT